MATLIKYLDNGEIANIYTGTESLLLNIKDEDDLLMDEVLPVSINTHYVSDGEIVVRPIQNTIYNETTRALSHLPVPSTITVDGYSYEIAEDTVILELDEGHHFIRVDAFPYQPWEQEIDIST